MHAFTHLSIKLSSLSVSMFLPLHLCLCLSVFVCLSLFLFAVTHSFSPSTFCPRSLCNSTKYPHKSRADKLIRHLHALSSPHTLIPHISIRIPSPSPPPSPPQHKANDDDFKISKLRGSILYDRRRRREQRVFGHGIGLVHLKNYPLMTQQQPLIPIEDGDNAYRYGGWQGPLV